MKLFLSFNIADIAIARWIAWNAERTGCEVVFQDWDFLPGRDFVEQMRAALESCDRLIAVLSPAYLEALFTHPEWYEFFRRDPTGTQALLLPIRVSECDPGPLLNTRIYVDLVGCNQQTARTRLLAALRGKRRKPTRPPPFPEAPFPQPSTPATAASDWSATGRNALELLAGLYYIARRHSLDLLNLFNDSAEWQRHIGLRKSFGKELKLNPQLVVQRSFELPSPASDLPALAAALFTVASACRSRLLESGPAVIQAGPVAGRAEYHIAPDDTPFVGDFPRHTEELSATLESLYLPGLRLSPVEVDGLRLTSVPLSAPTRAKLRECRLRRELSVALCSLGGGAELEGESLAGFPATEPSRFRLTGLKNGAEETANLLKTLRETSAQGAAVLVLPELRVTPAMEGEVQQFLANGGHSLALVVAGSWHYAAGAGWENRCTILGARGEVVWQHRKLREYRATAENAAAAPDFFARVGIGAEGGSEAISPGRVIEFCDTPIGRLCVAICVGFFHPDLQPALAASGADYFFVPAMTSRTRDLQDVAGQLARLWAATLVANCGVVGRQAPCFYRKPFRNENIEPASSDLVFVDFSLSYDGNSRI